MGKNVYFIVRILLGQLFPVYKPAFLGTSQCVSTLSEERVDRSGESRAWHLASKLFHSLWT